MLLPLESSVLEIVQHPDVPAKNTRELESYVKRRGTVDLEDGRMLVDCPRSSGICELCPAADPRPDEPGYVLGCHGPLIDEEPPLQGCRYHPDRFQQTSNPDTQISPAQVNESGSEAEFAEPHEIESRTRGATAEPEPMAGLPSVQELVEAMQAAEPAVTYPDFRRMSDSEFIDYVCREGSVKLNPEGDRWLVKCPQHDGKAVCGLIAPGGNPFCTGPIAGWYQESCWIPFVSGKSYTAAAKAHEDCRFNPRNTEEK